MGTPLVQHPKVKAISFTGSVSVGRQVRDEATALGKRVQLELGGHNPLIVMADADLDRAVEAAYAGAFWSAGQKCTATRRIYVQDAVYDDFRARLLERIERGTVGDPAEPATEVGPIVNEKQLDEILAGIERGKAEGGTVARRRRAARRRRLPARADRLRGRRRRRLPLLRGGLRTGHVPLPLRRLDEALRRANAVEFGLSASIFTSDLATAQRFVNELEAGILHVNSQTAGADVHVPFGGIKSSGFGPHEQGRAAIEFYTEVVTVYHDV